MTTNSQTYTDAIALATAALTGKFIFMTTTGVEDPSWVQLVLGPLGALVVLGCVSWWLSKRNEKLDARAEASQQLIISLITKTTEAVTSSREVIERNTAVLSDVHTALRKHEEHQLSDTVERLRADNLKTTHQ